MRPLAVADGNDSSASADPADGSEAADASEPSADSSALAKSLGAIIAERVREFRRGRGWTVGMLAAESGLSKGMLSKIENAQSSPSLATLARLSEALGVPVTAFFRGLSEEQDLVYVKAGGGLDIQHKGSGPGHRYQMLGTMRAPYDSLEPMLVTLTERTEVFPLYQHAGTELLFMITGKMEYCYGDQRYLLEPGDAMQFVGEVMHGPGELLTLPIQFLAIKSVIPGG
ncbi:MAG: helix-turn-helix transcriptional regulator [Geodermatophilaceae bacterium]|nr:helix-turn-helix transcriptional regulator [Geodermatophilaceae bacterium]